MLITPCLTANYQHVYLKHVANDKLALMTLIIVVLKLGINWNVVYIKKHVNL